MRKSVLDFWVGLFVLVGIIALLFLALTAWMIVFSVKGAPMVALSGVATLVSGLVLYGAVVDR